MEYCNNIVLMLKKKKAHKKTTTLYDLKITHAIIVIFVYLRRM